MSACLPISVRRLWVRPRPRHDSGEIAESEVVHGGLLRNLNPEQLAAVTLPPRPALILAGAGSGKTRVLTTRIAWLIQTGQLSPGGVMAVTFTNKAAKEMLTRLGGDAAAARARHVGRHLPRPVQPLPARALEAGRRCRRASRFSIRPISCRPSSASSRR